MNFNQNQLNKLKMLHEYASQYDGVLLSDSWVNWDTRYDFKCKREHCFSMLVRDLKRGVWCFECKRNLRIEKLKIKVEKKVFEKKGNIKFGNAKTSSDKVMLSCSEGHTWTTSINHLLGGSWCGSCYHIKSRASLTEFQEIAKSKSGECLSKSYSGAIFKLRFRCKDGHVWDATGNSIKKGSWCGACERRKRHGI